jgi:hypothetical protein
VPTIRAMAKRKGVRVRVVDVDKCGETCNWVTYTPLIKVDGRIVQSVQDLVRMLR